MHFSALYFDKGKGKNGPVFSPTVETDSCSDLCSLYTSRWISGSKVVLWLAVGPVLLGPNDDGHGFPGPSPVALDPPPYFTAQIDERQQIWYLSVIF